MKPRPPHANPVTYAMMRTALIGYGLFAFSMLPAGVVAAQGIRFFGLTPRGVLAIGIAVQVLLIVVRLLVTRYAEDRDTAMRGFAVLVTLADGLTVLLFAAGTLGAMLGAAAGA